MKLCPLHRCPLVQIVPDVPSVCVIDWIASGTRSRKIVDFAGEQPNIRLVFDNGFSLPGIRLVYANSGMEAAAEEISLDLLAGLSVISATALEKKGGGWQDQQVLMLFNQRNLWALAYMAPIVEELQIHELDRNFPT